MSGSIKIDGKEVLGTTPRHIREAGLAYVPEERMKDGAIGPFTIAENLMLLAHDKPDYASRGFIKRSAVREHAQQLVDKFRVKTPTIDTTAQSLSGGNIQKMIIARALLVPEQAEVKPTAPRLAAGPSQARQPPQEAANHAKRRAWGQYPSSSPTSRPGAWTSVPSPMCSNN